MAELENLRSTTHNAGASGSEPEQGHEAHNVPPLPADAMIIVPVRNFVLFPGMVMPVTVGRQKSIAAAQQAVREQRPVGILKQRDPEVADPTAIDMHRMGTVANVVRYITGADGANHLICQGEQRFQVLEFLSGWPFMVARVLRIPESTTRTPEIEARFLHLRGQALESVELLPQAPQELVGAIQGIENPGALADLAVSYMDVKPEEKQEILETVDITARMEKVSRLLAQRIEVLKLSAEIGKQTRASLDERQREVLLREQMAAIQKQLGEGEEGKAEELAELEKKIAEAGMPKDVEDQAKKELRRLQRMPEAQAEYGMVRTYLDWLIELPWKLPEETPIDIKEARRVLDADHYGLDKIKKRIVEFLAVRKLAPQGKAPILCFVGPPGVGKTSLGQSIARAMNRKFVRVSLGGVHDEAAIRGHRRTYVGALPGQIIQGMKKSGTINPVFMMDEVDKIGHDFRGDPSAALLEVLDPEQNNTFADHYLEIPYDLSNVMFVATANVSDPIPPPLRDRMEVLEIPGYTRREKLAIARQHLIPKQLEEHGLKPEQLTITDEAVEEIIEHYTREAGVRSLERTVASVIRGVAVKVAEGDTSPRVIKSEDDLHQFLGAIKYTSEVAERTEETGVATGLAWTAVGGEILFIEVTRMFGSGKLQLTGQLGDVMKESAHAALSYVRTNAEKYGLAKDFLEKSDIHVHIPAGAMPKDGPSAGITMFTAIVSLLTGIRVRHDVAMTGEISLRGRVLPIGGLKEKTLAAHRAGIKRVIVPDRNKADLDEVPKEVRDELEFVFVNRLDEVLKAALESMPQPSQAYLDELAKAQTQPSTN